MFGAADYAAMLAVNDPNVVLGNAELRFVAPVEVPPFVATGTCTRDLRVALELGGLTTGEAQCAAPWLTDFEVDYLIDVVEDRTNASFDLILAAATIGSECLTPDRIADLSRIFL